MSSAKGVIVKLGPFDGLVAALHPAMPEYYISSPNCNHIFLPPGPAFNIYAWIDGHYGQDDHTKWQQPYSQKYPFLSCIPKGTNDDENSIIWQDPIYKDFEWIIWDGVNIRLGKWPDWLLELLGNSC